MSRFVHLEFGDQSGQESHLQPAQADEAHCLGEARRAFEEARFEQSLRLFARALEFNPANAGAWSGQVRTLIELGEFHEAKLWADKALEKFPHDPELLAAKAVALGRLGDFDAAMAFSDAAFEERGESAYLWLARADVFLARQEIMADVCFARALAACQRDWVVAWLAARIRMNYEQFAQALKHAQIALDWNPSNALVWATVAACQSRLGLVHLAEASLARALELDPHCDPAIKVRRELGNAGLMDRAGGWLRSLFIR
jgi:tetratricopeptide (TPR) repeat protein